MQGGLIEYPNIDNVESRMKVIPICAEELVEQWHSVLQNHQSATVTDIIVYQDEIVYVLGTCFFNSELVYGIFAFNYTTGESLWNSTLNIYGEAQIIPFEIAVDTDQNLYAVCSTNKYNGESMSEFVIFKFMGETGVYVDKMRIDRKHYPMQSYMQIYINEPNLPIIVGRGHLGETTYDNLILCANFSSKTIKWITNETLDDERYVSSYQDDEENIYVLDKLDGTENANIKNFSSVTGNLVDEISITGMLDGGVFKGFQIDEENHFFFTQTGVAGSSLFAKYSAAGGSPIWSTSFTISQYEWIHGSGVSQGMVTALARDHGEVAYNYTTIIKLNYTTGVVEFQGNVSLDGIISSYTDFIGEVEDSYNIVIAGQLNESFQLFASKVEIIFTPPDPPTDLEAIVGVHQVHLNWSVPRSGGVPITDYYIYRGNETGGPKVHVGNCSTNKFTDTNFTAEEYNRIVYYEVRAKNILGIGDPSAEIQTYVGPYLRWTYPDPNMEYIFDIGVAVFNFSYFAVACETVILEFEGLSRLYDVTDTNSIEIQYSEATDGLVTAHLYGSGEIQEPVAKETRQFFFSKKLLDVKEVLSQNETFIGEQLRAILHDPMGDNSYAGFEESTTMTSGTSFKFASDIGVEVTIGEIFSLETSGGFIIEQSVGYTAGLTAAVDVGFGASSQFDFITEYSDFVGLTSNQNSDDPNLIGPGRGDTYWGEAVVLVYALYAQHVQYYNGTELWIDPKLDYLLRIRSEVFLDDAHAPQEWRDKNPVYNGWNDVTWLDQLTVQGGVPYTSSYTSTGTSQTQGEINLHFGMEAVAKIPGLEARVYGTTDFQWLTDDSSTDSNTRSYTVHDDEPEDLLAQDVGIDRKYGTFIFRSLDGSLTSNPLENETTDYVPPVINQPTIQYDSNFDGVFPCVDDKPIVKVNIYDEAGIQENGVLIYFKFGDNPYDTEPLHHLGGDVWQGNIPSISAGNTVSWHITAYDTRGQFASVYHPFGEDFQYTVINRPPTVEIISPNGGENLTEIVTITWDGYDLDMDTLTYNVAYEREGIGWYLIAENITAEEFSWNMSESYVFRGTAFKVKVVVRDEHGILAEDVSDYVFTAGMDMTDYLADLAEDPNRIPGYPLMTLLSLIAISVHIFLVKIKKRSVSRND